MPHEAIKSYTTTTTTTTTTKKTSGSRDSTPQIAEPQMVFAPKL